MLESIGKATTKALTATSTLPNQNFAEPLTNVSVKSPTWLPSFFVVGPPRTGTSWIHEILRRHVNLPSAVKETRFFDTHFHRGLDWYEAYYQHASDRIRIGEIAPTYFASSAARERIAQLIPSAMIVCIFRHPVERLWSLYRLKSAYGMIHCNLENALVRDPELLESSKYASHLKAWQLAFGKQNVLATVYEDLCCGPQRFMDQLADFIGISRFSIADSDLRRVHQSDSLSYPRNYCRTRSATAVADWFKARRLGRLVTAFNGSPLRKYVIGGGPPFPEIPQGIVRHVCELLRPEVEELETLLNRDLSAWKSCDPIRS